MKTSARSLVAISLSLGLLSLAACSRKEKPVLWTPESLKFFQSIPEDADHKYVHMMHLDGFRPDLFKALLDTNRLPHFQFLGTRGKYTTEATTVDKSETMKVVESYLTSRRDTYVTAWWQFSRDVYDFKNFWINPVQVANYGLGLEFPVYPTALDVVSGPPLRQSVMSGFALHRRGVPFERYARAYTEGARAAFDFTYFNQLDATVKDTVRILEKSAESGDVTQIPRLSTSLLASADEMAHWKGVIRNPKEARDESEFCFQREKNLDSRPTDPLDKVFEWVDDDWDEFQSLAASGHSYFTRMERTRERSLRHPIGFEKASTLCVALPLIEVHSTYYPDGPTTIKPGKKVFAHPYYVIGMMMVDFQLGRLIDAMRSVRFDSKGGVSYSKEAPRGLSAYIRKGERENSLFEKTMFFFYADHGMMDSKYKMLNAASKDKDYIEKLPGDFIKLLNDELGLQNSRKDAVTDPKALIGIDDSLLPAELAKPYAKLFDDKSAVAPRIQAARDWASPISTQLAKDFAESVKKKIIISGMLEFLGIHFVANKIDEKVNQRFTQYHNSIVDALVPLKLLSDKEYMEAELQKKKEFYETHVRLVYGGGAKNNAELFLPSTVPGSSKTDWSRRPSTAQILAARPGGPTKPTLLETLKKNPGVGLIFIRNGNDFITSKPGLPLPETMDILVTDPFDNKGTIRVRRDIPTGELVYSYRVEKDSPEDPLGLNFSDHNWHSGTYSEWTDRSVTQHDYYRNPVAGMGSYLYSKNPSIGDITVMHRQGWNFGDNSGGHGGLHQEEKQTVMMVSGPGIKAGETLMATGHYTVEDSTKPETRVVFSETGRPVYPTLVDPAPTALQWLGYGDQALGNFARTGFESYLKDWTTAQNRECSANVAKMLVESLHRTNYESQYHFVADDLKGSIQDIFNTLCTALPGTIPKLPDFRGYKADGNMLDVKD